MLKVLTRKNKKNTITSESPFIYGTSSIGATRIRDRHYLEKDWGEYFGGSEKVVFEVGCGTGNTVFPLVAAFPIVFVHACDFSPESHSSFKDGRVDVFVCDVAEDDQFSHIRPSLVDVVTLSSEEENAENLEDEDADCEATNRNRARRFVIEDDDEEDEEEKEVQNEITGIDSSDFEDEEEEEEDVDDVIKKALRKCGSISAKLKRELYGTTAAAHDAYSVVDINSSVGIITQDDVNKVLQRTMAAKFEVYLQSLRLIKSLSIACDACDV